MTSPDSTFGASFGAIFMGGVRGYVKHIVALTLASAATLGTYLVFRFPAQNAFDRGDIFASLALDLVGLLLASIVAYPWYCYALDAADGKTIDLRRPFQDPGRFRTQAVSSFWFWAGVLLGLRYLLGLPSIIVVLFYAFYGFVIADGEARGGLRALGTSVRLGEGRRIGLFALAAVFLIFNLCGAIAVGYDVNPFTIVLAVVGLTITTNITMVAGAGVYRLLLVRLKFQDEHGSKK